VILLITLVAWYFILLPRELRYLGGSAVSTLLFASNSWHQPAIAYLKVTALF